MSLLIFLMQTTGIVDKRSNLRGQSVDHRPHAVSVITWGDLASPLIELVQ